MTLPWPPAVKPLRSPSPASLKPLTLLLTPLLQPWYDQHLIFILNLLTDIANTKNCIFKELSPICLSFVQMFAHTVFIYQVTILQCSRDPGLVENFPFLLDRSVSNTTIYITGTGLTFNLRSPTGKFRDTFN